MNSCVWIHSPYLVLTEALDRLVKELGFDTCFEQSPRAELALWDLSTLSPPYPAPALLPTLAIINGHKSEAVSLLQRRYRGYLTSKDDGGTLKAAIEAVRRGEIWADRVILTYVIDSSEKPQLTRKEQQVLHQLTKGFSNRTIGSQLGIAEGTVKMHVSRIFSKLGVKSRTELIAKQIQG